MRSGTLRGVSKWSKHKDQYIGRLYSDFGKVPSDSGIFRSAGELRKFVGEYMGLIGPYGNRGERPKGRRHAPPLWSELDKGGGPLFLLPLLLFSSPTRKGGVLLPVGVGLPPWRALLLGRSPSPLLLYIRGQGAPHRHNNN